MSMKKSICLLVVFLVCSCGSSTNTPDKETIVPIKDEVKDFLPYQYFVPQAKQDEFGFGISVPDGFILSSNDYKTSGNIIITSKDGATKISMEWKNIKGHTDAKTFLELDMIKDSMSGFSISGEETIEPWSTPFPGEEDITPCQATFAQVQYDREQDGQKFEGRVMVWWYDVPEKNGKSVGLMTIEESKQQYFESILPKLEEIRRSYLRLPSYNEIAGKAQRAKVEPAKFDSFGKADVEDRLLQYSGGTQPGPGFNTLLKDLTPAYDEETGDNYLVKRQETPSGLLPNPKRPGMTVKPGIPAKIYSYLLLKQN